MSAHARPFTPEQQQLAERVCAVAEDAYYEILQVQEEAHEDQVKRAFKRLALQLHPDKNAAPRAEDAFKLVAEAWAVLGNPQKRAAYDEQHRRGFQRNPFDGLYASDEDDFLDDDPPPLNETRKQRRKREFEARRRARERARQEEWARRQAVNIEELLDILGVEIHYCANCGTLHLHMRDEPEQHDRRTPTRATHPTNPWPEADPQDNVAPPSPSESTTTRRRKKNRKKRRAAGNSPVDVAESDPITASNQSEQRSVALEYAAKATTLFLVALVVAVVYRIANVLPSVAAVIWSSWWGTISFGLLAFFIGVQFVPLPPEMEEEMKRTRRTSHRS